MNFVGNLKSMEMDSSVLVEVVWKCLAHFELQQYIEFKYPHSYIKEQVLTNNNIDIIYTFFIASEISQQIR